MCSKRVCERQVRGLGRPCDVCLAILASRRRPNVLAALRAARETCMTTFGFTGAGGGATSELCDLFLLVLSEDTLIIQQVPIVAGHAICRLVEQELTGAVSNQSRQ